LGVGIARSSKSYTQAPLALRELIDEWCEQLPNHSARWPVALAVVQGLDQRALRALVPPESRTANATSCRLAMNSYACARCVSSFLQTPFCLPEQFCDSTTTRRGVSQILGFALQLTSPTSHPWQLLQHPVISVPSSKDSQLRVPQLSATLE
jgi:hypothetical protein